MWDWACRSSFAKLRLVEMPVGVHRYLRPSLFCLLSIYTIVILGSPSLSSGFLTSSLNCYLCFTMDCDLWRLDAHLQRALCMVFLLAFLTVGFSPIFIVMELVVEKQYKLVQNSKLELKVLWEKCDLEGLCVTRNGVISIKKNKICEKRICEMVKMKRVFLPISLKYFIS